MKCNAILKPLCWSLVLHSGRESLDFKLFTTGRCALSTPRVSTSHPVTHPFNQKEEEGLTMTCKQDGGGYGSFVLNIVQLHVPSLDFIKQKTRQKTMEVKTNKRRGDPGKPPGLHRTAGCTVELISSHNRVFDYLRDIQNRPQWERMSSGSLVQELANITMGPDPRNCISVLAMSNHKEILILQECCTDATGSYVIFAPITPNDFQSMLYGVDQDLPLMPFGFSILPNVSWEHT
ncbi:hypothetical protein M0R45_036076 [Rubus argutus]|uniref:HD-Zip IV C-terminal domain-containing protein n=1 Tax=Rubus argutus TaxID=59490 RepID=A0AAW1VUZ2_RUBAR